MKLAIYATALAMTWAFTDAASLTAQEKEKEKPKTTEGAEISKTDVVESGTYKVTAHKVDPGEKEIYVKTDDGKTLELYLKDHTVITKGSSPAKFDALQEGQKLEVKVEKKGKKLDPLEVKILD